MTDTDSFSFFKTKKRPIIIVTVIAVIVLIFILNPIGVGFIPSHDPDRMIGNVIELPEAKSFIHKYGELEIKPVFSTVKLKAYLWSDKTVKEDGQTSKFAEHNAQLRVSVMPLLHIPYFMEYSCSELMEDQKVMERVFVATSDVLEHIKNHNCFEENLP